MKRIEWTQFAELFRAGARWIDVRAPIEFKEGSVPNAVNLPLMNDDERAAVGTMFKREGSEAAVELGTRLVSGAIKDGRIAAWVEETRRHPEAALFCFRGGLRSQISQNWLSSTGVDRPIVEGGYKALRRFLRGEVQRAGGGAFVVVAGPTGSGKTDFLRAASEFSPALDLEKCAHHRGSAFGAFPEPQPSQVDFENRIAVDLLRLPPSETAGILVEDESRMIGSCVVPESLYAPMKDAPVIVLAETIDRRVDRILRDYVLQPLADDNVEIVFAGFLRAIRAIEKRLGGLRATEILNDIEKARAEWIAGRDEDANRVWIRKLLEWYYDPLYERGLERRGSRVLFRGPREEALAWWRANRA